MLTVGLYTLGCKVSQYETEAISELFEDAGYTVLPFDSVCDAYVINTCTVTAESDRKSRQVIRRAIKKNPDAVVAVVGCYSQRSPGEISEIDGVDIIIGTNDKSSVVPLVTKLLKEGKGDKTVKVSDLSGVGFEPMTVRRAPRTRAYLKIEDGCEAKCTYCAISAARGPVRSKPREQVIREVEALYSGGIREIVLTGIETGSYGKDFDFEYRLADLICELDGRNSCERLRLGSLAPELITGDFIEKVRGAKILAPHFHLSMQSGSDKVLRDMKRRYTKERALKTIEALRAAFPTASFTTDLMVGFPGESEEDFLETVDFVRTARLLDAHVFAYSKREGTPAATYSSQVPEHIKRERSERLIKVKNEVRDAILTETVRRAEPLSVIVEAKKTVGTYSAHSDNYVEVELDVSCGADLQGEIVYALPVSHNSGIVKCKLIQ